MTLSFSMGSFYGLTLSVAIDGDVNSIYNIGAVNKKEAVANATNGLMPQRAATASNNNFTKKTEDVNINDKNSSKNLSNTDIRFSLKSFSEQVDDVLGGADTTSTHLMVSKHTPKLLVDIGLNDKPMLITSAHTKTATGSQVKSMNVHNLSVETFKMLPELINTPAIVMDSTKQGSIVMFVNAKDTDGNPVLCAINVDGRGRYNDVTIHSNVVTSVYGKSTNPIGYISKAVDDGRVLYWNKKMSQDLFDSPGLQLSDEIFNLDSDVIIHNTNVVVKNNLQKNLQDNLLGNYSRQGNVSKRVGYSEKFRYGGDSANEIEQTNSGIQKTKRNSLNIDDVIGKGKISQEILQATISRFDLCLYL